MKKIQLILGLAILLAAALGFASRNDPSSDQDQGITTPGGLEYVTLIDIPWIEGEWQSPIPGAKIMTVTRISEGTYDLAIDQSDETLRVTIIDAGCERFVEFVSDTGGETAIVYARLNGHSERLSMDRLSAIFPMTWELQYMLDIMEIEGEEEVPLNRRIDGLLMLSSKIDEYGTMYKTDQTFFRPERIQRWTELKADN